MQPEALAVCEVNAAFEAGQLWWVLTFNDISFRQQFTGGLNDNMPTVYG